jgi:hypothetical protein
MPRCWSNSRTTREAAAGRGCGSAFPQNSDGWLPDSTPFEIYRPSTAALRELLPPLLPEPCGSGRGSLTGHEPRPCVRVRASGGTLTGLELRPLRRPRA